MEKHLGSNVFAGNDKMGLLVENEHACAIKRVLDARSHDVVGWLYQWGTGDLCVMWKGERCDDVIYE
jgi:hypothetical protein